MRTEEDELILAKLKALAKIPNMLGVSHWKGDGMSVWSFSPPTSFQNGIERRTTTKTGDEGAIEFWKAFHKEFTKSINVETLWKYHLEHHDETKEVFSGLYEQMKNSKPTILKMNRETLMKLVEELFNKPQETSPPLTYNQLDINQIIPLLPPHEKS